MSSRLILMRPFELLAEDQVSKRDHWSGEVYSESYPGHVSGVLICGRWSGTDGRYAGREPLEQPLLPVIEIASAKSTGGLWRTSDGAMSA